MKLVLKIAAGILLAWGAILTFALVSGVLVGAAFQKGVVQPTQQRIQQDWVAPLQDAAKGSPETTMYKNPFMPGLPTEDDLLLNKIRNCEKQGKWLINGVCRDM